MNKHKNELFPEDCIYDKSYVCPVCENSFKSKSVRKGKAKFVSKDIDLKDNYTPIQPDYYDVIVCTRCGYASISSKFDSITATQADWVLNAIEPKFIPKEYPEVYSAYTAIERYELALESCIAKKGKNGEKAFIYLKMAWIYRDIHSRESENKYLSLAYDDFNEAFSNENFPICGLDESTLLYVLSAIAMELGNKYDSMKILSNLSTKRDIGERMKDKIKELKNILVNN